MSPSKSSGISFLKPLPEELQTAVSEKNLNLDDELCLNKLAPLLAEHYGNAFTPTHKAQLTKVYLESANEAAITRQKLASGKLELSQARNELAQTLGKLAFQELQLFCHYDCTNSPRFTGWKPSMTNLKPSIQDNLQKGYQSLLDGSYLKQSKDAVKKEETILTKGSPTQIQELRQKFRQINSPINNPLAYNRNYLPTGVLPEAAEKASGGESPYTDTRLKPTEQWQVRVFVAEHPVFGGELSDVDKLLKDTFVGLGLDWETGLVHTGVVAGIWKLSITHIKRKYNLISEPPTPLPLPPYKNPKATKSSLLATKLPTGLPDHSAHLLETAVEHELTEFSEKFHGWEIANGCAAWFQTDDKLRLCLLSMFPSQEEALNWVYSFTPHNGNYYRVRACAYPVGVYGIHWVCHQNVNAFSSRRWNTILLDNPISMLVFGPLGNFASPLTGSFPVSREKCPILGCSKQERFGGVPGKGLHYQQPPFFADWAMHNLTESNMENGAGFNLDRCYIPGQDRNVPTKAHYTQRELLTFDDADDALCQPPVFVSGWV